MNKIAIAFSTKDRVELSKRTIEPLLQPDKFDLFWIDGSTTPAGQELPEDYSHGMSVRSNVRGGADAAIVYALTEMLKDPQFEYVGLVENDVLLDKDWFEPTMELFERGAAGGLNVGAVSARCYEDRVLFQRDGYAVMHNLGAGMVIFTRDAARSVLDNFRTTHTLENRRLFAQVSGIDIGTYWAFRTNEQFLCADWGFDKILNHFGYASLALTPSKVEMIGQVPSLEEQGLRLVDREGHLPPAVPNTFYLYRDRLKQRFERKVVDPNCSSFHQSDDGQWTIFPHQMQELGGAYDGDWRLKWSQGFGPFTWEAGDGGEFPFHESIPESPAETRLQCPTLTIPVSGPCSFMVSGGEKGGKVCVEDLHSGYKVDPMLPPEGPSTSVLNCVVPGGVTYRPIRLTMLTSGCRFYGLQTREAQPMRMDVSFDHSVLPPV